MDNKTAHIVRNQMVIIANLIRQLKDSINKIGKAIDRYEEMRE